MKVIHCIFQGGRRVLLCFQEGIEIGHILIRYLLFRIFGHDRRTGVSNDSLESPVAHIQVLDHRSLTVIAVGSVAGEAVMHGIPALSIHRIAHGGAATTQKYGQQQKQKNRGEYWNHSS